MNHFNILKLRQIEIVNIFVLADERTFENMCRTPGLAAIALLPPSSENMFELRTRRLYPELIKYKPIVCNDFQKPIVFELIQKPTISAFVQKPTVLASSCQDEKPISWREFYNRIKLINDNLSSITYIIKCIQKGYIMEVQFVLDNNLEHLKLFQGALMNSCARAGHIKILKLLARHMDLYPFIYTIAVQCGHIDIMNWVFENKIEIEDLVADYAVKHNHLEALKLCYKHGKVLTLDGINCVIHYNRVEIFKWLFDQNLLPNREYFLLRTLDDERIEMAEYMLQNHVIPPIYSFKHYPISSLELMYKYGITPNREDVDHYLISRSSCSNEFMNFLETKGFIK